MRVASIVVNRNNGDVLPACLESLRATTYHPHRILVVDNGSNDGSIQDAKNLFREVNFLELGENVGYGAALNKGIDHVGGEADAFLLLNSDVKIDSACVGNLVAALRDCPRVGIAGPWIYDPESPADLVAAGSSLRPWTLLTEHQFSSDKRIRDVPFVTGCGFLVTKEAWEAAGPLDESYFLYYEEVDFCILVKRSGFRVVAVPSARLWHRDVWSRWEQSSLQVYFVQRNRIRFLRKHGTALQRAFHAFYIPAVHLAYKFLELSLVAKSTYRFYLYLRALFDGLFKTEYRPRWMRPG